MPEVVAIGWVIALVVGGLLLGLAAGWGISRASGGKTRVAELQEALDSANEELADYKREVFGEFAETAEKFRALDKSYTELHQQLAKSSVALCGDSATPLLAGPGPADALEEKEIEATDAETAAEAKTDRADAEEDVAAAPEVTDSDDGQAEDVRVDDPATEPGSETETAAQKDEDIVVAEAPGDASAGTESETPDAAKVADVEDIPTLTDTETPRRESA